MRALKNLTTALLEVGTEEIPARFMRGLLADLKQKTIAALEKAEIPFEKMESLGTARRLALIIEGLPVQQADRVEERKGPPAEVAYAADGAPTLAAVGFAKSAGVSLSKLVKKELAGRFYIFASVLQRGRPMPKILAEIFPSVLSQLELPIAMRWGQGTDSFIRPVHWILALSGSGVIAFQFAGIRSGRTTWGRRFVSKSPVNFPAGRSGRSITRKDYVGWLRRVGVLVDPEDRKKRLRQEAEKLAAKRKGKPLWTEVLIEELVFLAEDPQGFLGTFRSEYLSLPRPVLETVLRKQQRYLPIADRSGELLPAFVGFTNGKVSGGGKIIQEGNERVLDARLADARFFFEEDHKIKLEERNEALRRVSFLGTLGSLYDKVGRLEKLSKWLAEKWGHDQQVRDTVRRVALLCKADLATEMVKEFPELEGVMGREYARLFGERAEIAEGIAEHYLPRGSEEELPQTVGGVVVSVADKLDSLVGAFGAGLSPSGSEDPYGLRRQGIALINLLVARDLSLPTFEAVEMVHGLYRQLVYGGIGKNVKELHRELWDFLQIRLRTLMEEQGIRYDVVNSVLQSSDDPIQVVARGKAIMKVIGEEWIRGVVLTADRVARLAAKATRSEVNEADFMEASERTVYALVLDVSERVQGAVRVRDFGKALRDLSRLTAPVEEFFVKVLVMHENEILKTNRLALLKTLGKLFKSVADFQQIVVQKEEQGSPVASS